MKLLATMTGSQRVLSAEIWGDLTDGDYGVVFKDDEAGSVLLSRRYKLQMAATRDALEFVAGDMMPRLIDFENHPQVQFA